MPTRRRFSNTTARRTPDPWSGLAADAYDAALPLGASFGEIEWYRTRLRGTCLEAACGSGRFLIPLLDSGLDIEGFDASPDMIARAKARLAALGRFARLEVADFASFDMGRRYASIVCAVSSLMMVPRETAKAFLGRAREHLEADGRLWVDLHTPPFGGGVETKQIGDITVADFSERLTDDGSETEEVISRGDEQLLVRRHWCDWPRSVFEAALADAGLRLIAWRDRAPWYVCEAGHG